MANNDEADSDFLTNAPMLADIWRQPRVLIDVTERIDEIKNFFNSFLSLKKMESFTFSAVAMDFLLPVS